MNKIERLWIGKISDDIIAMNDMRNLKGTSLSNNLRNTQSSRGHHILLSVA